MKTAAASSASVGLDEGRIVTLNEKSRVEFKKQDGAVAMNLTEGKIFLDVSEKLGANETMDITTATMAIGIRGTIVYVSSEPVTDAGTTDNPYTIDWGNTNPNNYTLTEGPGLLEVTAKKVTITTGSAEKLYDGETLFYDNYELSPSDPWVNGQAPKITITGSITNVGINPNTCMIEWKGVNPNNYEVTQELGTLTVKPVEIVLIQNCAFGVAGNVTIESYGLKVQVSDVDLSYYDVTPMDENRWWLQFEWGDKIEAQIVVVTDETSFAITPVYDFVLGDSGNYKINTVDATGEFDAPPIYPVDGFGMGNPAGFSSVADSSLDDGEASPTPAEVAPAGSDPAVELKEEKAQVGFR